MRLASTTYVGTILGVLTGPIVARTLGATGRGEYAAVMIYSSSVVAILSLGMGLTVNYALLTLRDDPRVVLGTILRFCGLLALPALVAAGVTAYLLNDLSAQARVGVVVFIAIAPLGVLQICLNSFLMAEGALGTLSVVRMAPLLTNAIGVVLLAVAGYLTIATYLGLTLFGVVLTLVIIVRGVGVRPAGGGALGPQLRFGLRAYPGSLALLGNNQLDQLFIAPLLGTRDLGLYAIAVTVANLPIGVAQAVSARAIGDMALPRGGLDRRAAEKVIRRALVLATAVTVLVAAVTPVLVPLLYGAEFEETVGICLILMPGAVAVTFTTLAAPALTISGRPGLMSISQFVGLAVTVVALLIAVPALGVIGAAIATLLAYGSRAAFEVFALRRVGVRKVMPGPTDVREVAVTVGTRFVLMGRRTVGKLRRT